ncbi:MAG: hypothetical protein ABI748_13140, partial [Dokdonella sp.]
MGKHSPVEHRERQGKFLANIGMDSCEQLEEILRRPCQPGQHLRSDLQIETGLRGLEALQPQEVAPAGNAGPAHGNEFGL